jgi:hypothetical protein
MEYILKGTDIFDKEIDQKLEMVICKNKDDFIMGKVYRFTVSFNINLLNDSKFQEFEIPDQSKTRKKTQKDKVSDVMSYQLERMKQVLEENGIESYSSTIQGDYLESDNIIKVEITEDTFEPAFSGRGKNKRRIKVCSIIPSLPFTKETVSKFASDKINKIYSDLMDIIKKKKIMAWILEIDETEDDNKLFKAFVEQYGDLWFTTNERKKELLQQLEDKAKTAVKRYIQQEEKYKNNSEE